MLWNSRNKPVSYTGKVFILNGFLNYLPFSSLIATFSGLFLSVFLSVNPQIECSLCLATGIKYFFLENVFAH